MTDFSKISEDTAVRTMTIQLVQDHLVKIGVPEDHARAAATLMADYNTDDAANRSGIMVSAIAAAIAFGIYSIMDRDSSVYGLGALLWSVYAMGAKDGAK